MMRLKAFLRSPEQGMGESGGAGGESVGGDVGGEGSAPAADGSFGGEGGGRQGPGPGATDVSDDAGLSGNLEADSGDGDEKPAKPPAPKYKTKRGGKEAEFTAEELAAMVSDDYEEEFRGPGGKPLKVKRAELERRVQQAEGWEARMRAAKELEKSTRQRIELAKSDPVLLEEYLETELGVQDIDKWVLDRARSMAKRDKQLASLIQPTVQGQDGQWYRNPDYNPTEYNRLMGEQAKSRFDRQTKAQQAREAAAKAESEKQATIKQRETAVHGALTQGKLPVNALTRELADAVINEHMELNVALTGHDLVREVSARYREAQLSQLQQMDDAALREYLGPDFRARLRKLEVTVSKDQKKGAAPAPANGAAAAKQKPMTEAAFRKMFG